MKKIAFLLVIAIAIVFTGCQPSAEDIEKAIAQTQAAAPTETPIPLQDIDLSQIMFMPGDLPAGYEPSQIRSEGVYGATLESGSINGFHQDVVFQGDYGGKVSVYLYATHEEAVNLFDQLIPELDISDFKAEEINGIGEKALGQNFNMPLIGGLDPIQTATVAFIRCNAVFVADFKQSSSYSGLVDYAKNLDGRLLKLICH
jgi:hypothetical protein